MVRELWVMAEFNWAGSHSACEPTRKSGTLRRNCVIVTTNNKLCLEEGEVNDGLQKLKEVSLVICVKKQTR